MMAVKILQPPVKSIIVLVHLFIIPSSRAQLQLVGPSKPIVVKVGDDTVLPCHLDPAMNVAAKTLEWTRPDLKPRFVNVWRAGQDLENVKNPSYSGRTSLTANELKKGNMSLKLSRVKPSDAGRYRCFIPDMKTDTFVELVVASDSASKPVIILLGTDRNKDGVTLNCESAGWYPEPEVLWLDGEGNLLSAGPTETVRGPDDLYTVSSRVTVEKRHSNSFTCRVQQKDTNQTREANFYVADDFFKGRSDPIIIGLAVSLAVWILVFVLLLVVFVWKRKPNVKKTKKRDETEEDNNHSTTNQSEEMKALKEKEKKKIKPEEQRTRKEAEREVQILKGQLKTQKIEFESEIQKLRDEQDEELERLKTENQNLKDDLGTKCNELSSFYQLQEKASQSKSWIPQFPQIFQLSRGKHEQTPENERQTVEEKDGQTLTGTMHKEKEDPKPTRPRQDSAGRHVIIEKISSAGKYVRLKNNSGENQSLEGWHLFIQVNNRKPIVFKFPRPLILSPGVDVTIWAAACGTKHETETDLVWWGQTAWGSGETHVHLYRDTGELEDSRSEPDSDHRTSQDSNKGTIAVYDVDPMGKCVSLRNISNQDQHLRDWELFIRINNRRPMVTKTSCFLSPGKITDVEWKEKSWEAGDELQVTLYNNTGELEASKFLETQSPTQWQYRCLTSQSSSKGAVIVDEVDLMGKYVRLINKSIKKEHLEGWELNILINKRKTIIHTIGDFSLSSEMVLTVTWEQESWEAGDQLQVTLYNKTKEEIFTGEFVRMPPPVKTLPN